MKKKKKKKNSQPQTKFTGSYKKKSLVTELIQLSYFMPMISFYTPSKDQKIRGFLMFSGGLEKGQ